MLWRAFDKIVGRKTLAPAAGAAKTAQELMRHANGKLTLDVYAQALTPAKRAAHLKLVEMIQQAAQVPSVPSRSHAESAEAVSA